MTIRNPVDSPDHMRRYDEGALRERLAALNRQQKTAFAAACAQRLLPLFDRYARIMGIEPEVLRLAADAVWHAIEGRNEEVGDAAKAAEALVPSDDGEWFFEMGYAQNAAAAVAYSALTWAHNDIQSAGWAARQTYEAADYSAQRALSALRSDGPATTDQLVAHPFVQETLRALDRDLESVEAPEADWARIRANANAEGVAWSASLP